MNVNIIGLGDSAKHWNGEGYSIGVNDAMKWGHKLNGLILINSVSRFKDEPERLNTIINSNPDTFYCNNSSWEKYFPNWKQLNLVSFSYSHRLIKGKLWCSKTSPFVAICLAVQLGATDVILWGVDMVTHKYYRPGEKDFDGEYKNYLRLFEKYKEVGVNIWRGADGSCFDKDLEIYRPKLEWKEPIEYKVPPDYKSTTSEDEQITWTP